MHELFEQEYSKCEKSLFLVALGYLHNTEDAKDCVQEAALSALMSYDRLKNKALFKTWITRIVINKCKDYLKKQRYTEDLSDMPGVFCEIPADEMDILSSVCALSTDSAVYITLRFYQDMTYREMAKTLREPVSTVKYKTKKALMELKKLLEGDGGNKNA